MAPFRLGDLVMLTSQKGKKWLVRIEDMPHSSHLGTIQLKDVLEKEEGDWLDTNMGSKVFLFRPTLEDFIFKIKRKTQIIYPKDLAAMVFYGDLQAGDVVLETGIGSGALTLALLRSVGEQGKVISVEKRQEFARISIDNINRFYGLRPSNHHIIISDILDLSLNIEVDRIFLDLPEPWNAISSVSKVLKRGGLLVSLSPNVGQLQLTFRELKAGGYANITTFEIVKRDWMIDERRARPSDRMRAHTGFIMVAKKVGGAFGSPQPGYGEKSNDCDSIAQADR
ncbi:MAG: tRNA (adenine-N1)-methyltransferase [Syntrophobacteraceae bacterium]